MKSKYTTTTEAAETAEQNRTAIGTLRIAKITYDHHPIYAISTDGVSIGMLIDEHIHRTINGGNLVSEVSLFFETAELQQELRKLYEDKY